MALLLGASVMLKQHGEMLAVEGVAEVQIRIRDQGKPLPFGQPHLVWSALC
jgi:hypothetical protein